MYRRVVLLLATVTALLALMVLSLLRPDGAVSQPDLNPGANGLSPTTSPVRTSDSQAAVGGPSEFRRAVEVTTAAATGTAASATMADAQPPFDRPPIQSLVAGVRPHQEELLFLVFHLERNQLRLEAAHRRPAGMPLPETVPLMAGIYHRVMSATGQILAQGVTPDPVVVHHDGPRPDGSGVLEGGTVRLESVHFDVRYPVLPNARSIELYQVNLQSDVQRLSPQSEGFYGSFPLP